MLKRVSVIAVAIAVGCLALAVADTRRGSVRRDVKPANILPSAHAGNGDTNPPNQATDEGYAPDTNFQAFRSTIAVADTLTTANILSLPSFEVSNRTSIYISARHSDSGATVGVRLAYIWRHPQAISNTDVTTRSFPWRQAAFNVVGANGSFYWASQSNASVISNQIKGWSAPYTLTAGTAITEGSYYPSTIGDLVLDSARAVTVRLVVTTAPSAGNVTFRLGS